MSTKALHNVMAVFLVMTTAGLAGAGELKTDWDLTDLYPDMEAWEKAKGEIPQMAEEIQQYNGKLGDGPANLLAVMNLSSKAQKEAARLYTYANLTSDLDIREPGPLGMKQELMQLFTELAATVAWVDPEILTLGWDTIERYLADEPELEIYADEVVASHGATVGQLDESAIFYMRTRGLSDSEARRMLTAAFCHAVSDRLGDAGLSEVISSRLDAAMPNDQPIAAETSGA